MPSVISIQSHVCYGHVGNSAAVFPMQKLGVEVHSLPTTILSNHPAHSSFYGQAIDANLLKDLIKGLEDRGALQKSEGIQSGYLATVENGLVIEDAVQRYKNLNPKGLYCLDPVMGDKGTGFFVREGIPKLIIDRLLPLADIITPNKFEFDTITKTQTSNYKDMVTVARELLVKNDLRCIAITSADLLDGTKENSTGVLIVKSEAAWVVTTPYLPFSPSGAGDLFTALFFARIIRGDAEERAAQKAIGSLFSIIEHTLADDKGELDIITYQKCIISPKSFYTLNIV